MGQRLHVPQCKAILDSIQEGHPEGKGTLVEGNWKWIQDAQGAGNGDVSSRPEENAFIHVKETSKSSSLNGISIESWRAPLEKKLALYSCHSREHPNPKSPPLSSESFPAPDTFSPSVLPRP